MELLDAILTRRSIRKYTTENIPEETITKILQAGLLSPTSRNRKPCEFVVVRNKDILKNLANAKEMGGGMLAKCNTAIVVTANSDLADTWIEDSSIALSYMHLMAASLGIGSCWCQIHLRTSHSGKDAEASVREILSLPDTFRIVGILSLGIPAEEPKPHTLEDTDFTKVHNLY